MDASSSRIGRWIVVFMSSLLLFPTEAALLSPLAPAPDWSALKAYQQTITHDEFNRLMNQVYSPDGGFWKYTEEDDKTLRLFSDTAHTQPLLTLSFATDTTSEAKLPVAYKTKATVKDPSRPLQGLRIALDPGHIGGDWAQLEERYFKLNDDPPVEEAKLNMITCDILAQLLQADGAEVVWAKHGYEPVTSQRPEMLRKEAKAWLIEQHKPVSDQAVNRSAALLFYRIAEIRARANLVNTLKPDLTVCVHYNADDWGNPAHPSLVEKSRLVIFINGSYEVSELKYDDQKFDLLRKLLDRTAVLEEKGCALVGQKLLDTLNYPPETYVGYFAHRQTSVPSVYARNLLASRLYHGPVIYCEGPYMNAKDAYPRLIAGDYLGKKEIAGTEVRSVYREYATSIESGLLQYFGVSP